MMGDGDAVTALSRPFCHQLARFLPPSLSQSLSLESPEVLSPDHWCIWKSKERKKEKGTSSIESDCGGALHSTCPSIHSSSKDLLISPWPLLLLLLQVLPLPLPPRELRLLLPLPPPPTHPPLVLLPLLLLRQTPLQEGPRCHHPRPPCSSPHPPHPPSPNPLSPPAAAAHHPHRSPRQ